MPSKYPVYSDKEVTKKLEKLGFLCVSQKGSHRKYKKDNNIVIVPMHKEIAKGTLKSILLQENVSLEEFMKV